MSRRFVLALAGLAAPLLAAADAPAPLSLTGAVGHPRTYTVAELKKLPARTADDFVLVSHTGAKLGGPYRYTGARLPPSATRDSPPSGSHQMRPKCSRQRTRCPRS